MTAGCGDFDAEVTDAFEGAGDVEAAIRLALTPGGRDGTAGETEVTG